MSVSILFPVGRIVQGSLYKGNTHDMDGRPLVYKNGADAGKPRLEFFFAVAIAKGAEQHWNQTVWGAEVWKVGATAFPAVHQRYDFAWKITDGDSSMPNKKGVVPSSREGFPGHWVISFKSSYAPQIWANNGKGWVAYDVADAVKAGYFVQIKGAIDSNGSEAQPGVYINPNAVAFNNVGPVIVTGENPDDIGFAPQQCATPVAIVNPMTVTPPAATYTPPPAAPATVAVVPNPAILNAGLPPPPAAPAAPLAAPVRVMLPAANGITYDVYRAAGWNDAQLVQSGYMVA